MAHYIGCMVCAYIRSWSAKKAYVNEKEYCCFFPQKKAAM